MCVCVCVGNQYDYMLHISTAVSHGLLAALANVLACSLHTYNKQQRRLWFKASALFLCFHHSKELHSGLAGRQITHTHRRRAATRRQRRHGALEYGKPVEFNWPRSDVRYAEKASWFLCSRAHAWGKNRHIRTAWCHIYRIYLHFLFTDFCFKIFSVHIYFLNSTPATPVTHML